MTKKAQILTRALAGTHAALWQAAWTKAVSRSLAEYVADCIDFAAGTASVDLDQIDDPSKRAGVLSRDNVAVQISAEILVQSNDVLNACLKQGHMGSESRPKLKQLLLKEVLGGVTASCASNAIVQNYPLEELWPCVADSVGSRTYTLETGNQPEPEWLLLNRLLIASYFQACSLKAARHVRVNLELLAKSFHGIRGSALRITEVLSPEGVSDAVPPHVSAQTATFQNSTLTPLLDTVSCENAAIQNGNGLFHRHLPVTNPVTQRIPPRIQTVMTPANIAKARSLMHRQYEASVLAYLSLASLEHLLRCWAEAKGVPHLKSNGEPKPVTNWYKRLGCSSQLLASVADLYETTGSNVRNRAMHGGLLECESKSFELLLTGGIMPAGTSSGSSTNHLLPTSLADYAIDVLLRADAEAAPLGLGRAQQKWVSALALSSDEIDFGHHIHCDLLSGQDALAWQKYISEFVTASAPHVSIFTKTAFLGWYKSFTPAESLLMQMCWGLVFEAMFRLAAHVNGIPILRRSNKGTSEWMIQYRMLTAWEGGLCTDAALERLLRNIPNPERELAKETVMLAAKARNGFSHGALSTWNERTHLGMGHLFAKGIQALIGSVIHHMTEEAAYYRWLRTRSEGDGSALVDWLSAEHEILLEISRRAASE